jgi:hypothetical protein
VLFMGCEHCGFVRKSEKPPMSATGFAAGTCEQCGSTLEWMSAEEAVALLEERREAERFRARAAEEARRRAAAAGERSAVTG